MGVASSTSASAASPVTMVLSLSELTNSAPTAERSWRCSAAKRAVEEDTPASATPSAIELTLSASAKMPYWAGPSARTRKTVINAVSEAVVSCVA